MDVSNTSTDRKAVSPRRLRLLALLAGLSSLGPVAGCGDSQRVLRGEPPKSPSIEKSEDTQSADAGQGPSPTPAPPPSPTPAPAAPAAPVPSENPPGKPAAIPRNPTPLPDLVLPRQTPPSMQPKCGFLVTCAANNATSAQLALSCISGESSSQTVSVSSCGKLQDALHQKALPTGSTTEVLKGGATEVRCAGKNGTISTITPNTSILLSFIVPDDVCLEFRNIVNGLKL